MITFKQQFDKLTEAYIRGEVCESDCAKCFVGNLLNGNYAWGHYRNIWHAEPTIKDIDLFKDVLDREAGGFYTPHEICLLEKVFMGNIGGGNYEDELFNAFCITLDLLKQIHESKGEIVEPFEFVKRQPVTA